MTKIFHLPYLLETIQDILDEQALTTPILCVCDANTYQAAGAALEMQAEGGISLLNLGEGLLPTLTIAQKLAADVANYPTILALGSGTVTDLCKYASNQAGSLLISIPTAASMNGYASATASLIGEDGQKTSHPAKAPDAIWLDESIYAHAPIRLQQAGLGDTLCRASVQLDARLSNLICGSWYDAHYFAELHAMEQELLSHTEKLAGVDEELCKLLMQSLLKSGSAMRNVGSSAPASQGEHMIAHALERAQPVLMHKHLHGAHIAVTSLTMLRLQHFLIHKGLHADRKAYLSAMERYGTPKVTHEKTAHLLRLTEADCTRLTGILKEELPNIIPDMDALEMALLQAGLPTSPEAIGILREDYATAIKSAFTTRDRLTFLDMAVMR